MAKTAQIDEQIDWAFEWNAVCVFMDDYDFTEVYILFNIIGFLLPVYDILTLMNILYIKRVEDVIQGINKLDILLKVSCFQKYKNEKA